MGDLLSDEGKRIEVDAIFDGNYTSFGTPEQCFVGSSRHAKPDLADCKDFPTIRAIVLFQDLVIGVWTCKVCLQIMKDNPNYKVIC